jgi:hypothetical protein
MKLNTILLFFIFIGFQNNFLFAQPPGTTNAQKIKWMKEHGKLKGLPNEPQGSIYQYANKTAFVPYSVQFDLTYTITSTFDTIYYAYDSNAQKTLKQHHNINSTFKGRIYAACDTLYGTTKTVGDDVYYNLTTNPDEKGNFKDQKCKVSGDFSLKSIDQSENEVEQTTCNEHRHTERKSEKWDLYASGDVFDESPTFDFNYEVLKDDHKSQGELNYAFNLVYAKGMAIKETECDGKTDLIAKYSPVEMVDGDGNKSTFPQEKYIAGLLMSGLNGNAIQGYLSEKTEQANAQLGRVMGNGAFVTKTKRGFIIEKAANIEAKKGNATTIINWHLSASLNDKPLKYEAILSPVDKDAYTNWVPEGPKPEGNGQEKDVNGKPRGNDIAFKIIVRDKKTKELATMPWKAKFYLTDNSHYKGWCTNYPLKSEDDTPDLRFDSNDTANQFEKITETNATTNTSVQSKNVSLISYDYAAYANLNADVIMDDGTKIETHVEDHSDAISTITIPMDDNGNHIADAWEKNKPFDGKPPTWDEDPLPAKQKRNGDGYTLFEEYRGFMVLKTPGKTPKSLNKEFIRLDPNTKDCFVYDIDDLFFKYYAPTNISKINWHYVDTETFNFNGIIDEDITHWTNYNTPEEYYYAKQYAAYIYKDEKEGNDDQGGGSVARIKTQNDHQGHFLDLRIAIKHAASELQGQYAFGPDQPCPDKAKATATTEQDYKQSVLHEIGHTIGISHHQPNATLNYNPINNRPIRNDEKREEASKYWGVRSCVMRYYNSEDQKFSTNHDCSLLISLDHYCTSEEKGTKKDWTESKSDNCWGQIDVKSDP